MKIVYGDELAEKIYAQLRHKIAESSYRAPCLAVVLVGDDPASAIYVAAKEKACQKAGIVAKTIRLGAKISQDELRSVLRELSAAEEVDGILLQLPLPETLPEREMLEAIDPAKDVDGLTLQNIAKLVVREKDGFLPCTPAGVMRLLREMKAPLSGKRAVIIGRSILVGLPLFQLLQQENCTVTLCHSKTEDLSAICQQADILVSAVGKAEMIKAKDVKLGAYVIDVGVSRVNGKIKGDIAFEEVKEKVAAITPMPRGTGPMTIASLLENTYLAYCRRKQND